MRNKGRFAALLAAAGILMTAMPAIPAAAEDEEELWYVRDYEDGTVSVSCNDKSVTEVIVPSEIDGKTITMIEVDAFKDCNDLTKVTIPDTVTVIEDYAFYYCAALRDVNFPRNLKNIGFQAFCGCSSLNGVTIPASCDDIEAFAFEGCASLDGVSVSPDNPAYKDEDGILFDKSGETLYLYPSANTSEEYALPEGCTVIYDNAFIGNPYLKRVDISGITSLGRDAFYYCTALERIDIPEGIEELDGSVFGSCTALTSVSLPQSLTKIGENCFYNCMQLSQIEIPEGVQSVGNNAFFNCPSLTRVHLTKNTGSIGTYAFGWYMGEDDKPKRLPDFEIDANDDTAAFTYCVNNSIKCTGGVTQGTVFIYIILGVIALVIILTILIVVMQKRIQKKYELN